MQLENLHEHIGLEKVEVGVGERFECGNEVKRSVACEVQALRS